MPAPRNYETEAIVIKKTKLGEADRILTLYTPEHGKVQAVAKGVRRTKARLTGHLELLTHSHVLLVRGRNLDTITGSQTISGFAGLKTDLWSSACALYATELVMQFGADHHENEAMFQALLEALQHLSGGTNSQAALRFFEMHLLDAAGYRPQLHECVGCRRSLEPVTNAFSYGSGGMLCPLCQGYSAAQPLSVNALKVLRLLQSDDYATLTRLRIDRELGREVEGVLRMYIRYLLDREIKCTAWLDRLRGEGMGGAPANGTAG